MAASFRRLERGWARQSPGGWRWMGAQGLTMQRDMRQRALGNRLHIWLGGHTLAAELGVPLWTQRETVRLCGPILRHRLFARCPTGGAAYPRHLWPGRKHAFTG
jgi:hypothetical protein